MKITKILLLFSLSMAMLLAISMVGTSHAADIGCDGKGTITLSGGFTEGDGARMANALSRLDTKYIHENGIDLVINSSGGSADNMFTVIGVLKIYVERNNAFLTTWGFGRLYSAGAVLFLMGDKRILAPTATIMLHFGAFYDQNGEKITRNSPRGQQIPGWAWRMLERRNKLVLAIIVKKTKMTKALIDKEIFMDAETALKYGVCTHIEPLTFL